MAGRLRDTLEKHGLALAQENSDFFPKNLYLFDVAAYVQQADCCYRFCRFHPPSSCLLYIAEKQKERKLETTTFPQRISSQRKSTQFIQATCTSLDEFQEYISIGLEIHFSSKKEE
jgi:hypothetical protein